MLRRDGLSQAPGKNHDLPNPITVILFSFAGDCFWGGHVTQFWLLRGYWRETRRRYPAFPSRLWLLIDEMILGNAMASGTNEGREEASPIRWREQSKKMESAWILDDPGATYIQTSSVFIAYGTWQWLSVPQPSVREMKIYVITGLTISATFSWVWHYLLLKTF